MFTNDSTRRYKVKMFRLSQWVEWPCHDILFTSLRLRTMDHSSCISLIVRQRKADVIIPNVCIPAIAMPRNTNVKLSHCNQFVTFPRQPSLCLNPSWPSLSSTWHAASSFGCGCSHGFSLFLWNTLETTLIGLPVFLFSEFLRTQHVRGTCLLLPEIWPSLHQAVPL